MVPSVVEETDHAVDQTRQQSDHPAWSPLSIHDMTVAYHRRPVLWDIDYLAPPGQLIAIIGPNGSGKTTLIKAALDLVPKASGSVRFFGKPYRGQRSQVAYVPQRGSVDWDFPINAMQVVAMGLYRKIGWFRPVTRKYRQQALAALERVGMADFAGRQINQLSGGQQQRVFLARALVQDAELYLMDEPFAGVDAATERAIVTILQEFAGRRQDGPGGASRPANRGRVFRPGAAAQHAAGGRRTDDGSLHHRESPQDLRR